MRWIRLEVAFDETWLFALSNSAQLAWVKLLCTAKRDGVRGEIKVLPATVASRKWGIPVEDVEAMYAAATFDGALSIGLETMIVTNWLVYQPLDKTAAQRQKKWKETHPKPSTKKTKRRVTEGNGVTDQVTEGNALQRQVTPGNGEKRRYVDVDVDTNKDINNNKDQLPIGSDEPRVKSWVSEGAEWWALNVGTVNPPRFGKALKDAVHRHGWPKIFDALKCYVEDAKSKDKGARPEWCASEIVKWVEWANMPATDANGDLTPRGRAIMGTP